MKVYENDNFICFIFIILKYNIHFLRYETENILKLESKSYTVDSIFGDNTKMGQYDTFKSNIKLSYEKNDSLISFYFFQLELGNLGNVIFNEIENLVFPCSSYWTENNC